MWSWERRVYAGAAVLIAGIAALIEASSHAPQYFQHSRFLLRYQGSSVSPTAYDVLRIGGWALVILGALTILLALLRYWDGR